MSYSQEVVIYGLPTACSISWDVLSHTHYADGTPPKKTWPGVRTEPEARKYISLKDLLISEIKLVDYRSYYFDDDLNEIAVMRRPGDSSNQFSGFVLALHQSTDSIIQARTTPNPSHITGSAYGSDPATKIYFSTQSDAERAKKALIHAATLCGAKADPF
jgi:hypothetical protein